VRLENDACTIADAQPRCITLEQPEGNGCSPSPCTQGDTSLPGAVARPLDASSFELIVAGDELCGVGIPIADWLPADDPSLGPCALDCGD